MNREMLAIFGSPSRHGSRLELDRQPGTDRLQLEQLHADDVGTFARVLSGRLGEGEFAIPVAVKLQRDASLSQEQSRGVHAKFAIERSIHRLIQTAEPTDDADGGHVVRQIDLSRDGGSEADVLPPSIVCAHALHALAPRCPADACPGFLEPDEWAQNDDERRLVCRNCGSRHSVSDGTRQRILEASVRRDPAACAGCPHSTTDGKPEECLRKTVFLNFFPSRVLVFERLDVDLHDYLEWEQRALAPPGRQRAWQRFGRHRKIRNRFASGGPGRCLSVDRRSRPL